MKLVYCLITLVVSTCGAPHSKIHDVFDPYEAVNFKPQNNFTAKITTSKPGFSTVKGSLENKSLKQNPQHEFSMEYNEFEVAENGRACTSFEAAWYYLFPFFVYFLLILAALGLFLIVVHCTLCLRKFLCPLLPLDVGFCHRTTVTEEKQPDCRNKDKLQLSLVNVNKHYYKLEGHDGP